MEVTPWEVIATLAGLATTIAGVVVKIIFDRLKTMQQSIEQQQDSMAKSLERQRTDMTETVGKIYQRIEADRLDAHRTFATHDSVERGFDKLSEQIKMLTDKIDEVWRDERQQRRQSGRQQ